MLADDLRSALAVLKERGRTTGVLVNNRGQVCPLGAIGCALVPDFDTGNFDPYLTDRYSVIKNNERAWAAVNALVDVIDPPNRRVDRLFDVVFTFNDKRDRTDEEVFDLFDQAIEAA